MTFKQRFAGDLNGVSLEGQLWTTFKGIWLLSLLINYKKKLSELDPLWNNLNLRMLDFFLQIVNSLN